jgi:hypothetical protein
MRVDPFNGLIVDAFHGAHVDRVDGVCVDAVNGLWSSFEHHAAADPRPLFGR